MNRRLLSRVARLEREAAPRGGVPFQFWQVVTGEVRLQDADAGTRAYLGGLLLEDDIPDEVEELLHSLS